jgi:aspartate kinase
VALAGALGANVCEIYTDVDGVYTADPRVVAGARKLASVTYEEMLELAAGGAKVLQLRSVEYARRHGVRLHVRSSFSDEPGTWVVEEDERMEQALISGVACDADEAKMTIEQVPDRPGVAAEIFRAVADGGIHVDMIVQNSSREGEGRTDLSFTVPKADLAQAAVLVEELAQTVGAAGHAVDDGIAKVSLVGAGMKSNPSVVADMFEALAAERINIEMISTSTIRISCVVRAEDADRAVQAVHAKFNLGDDPAGAGEGA